MKIQYPTTGVSTLDALYNELEALEKRYGTYLSQDELDGDVRCLKEWIESYHQGDKEAAEYLEEHGKGLLENIKLRLQDEAEAIQRMDGESPNAENFSGGKADRLNRAAKTAMRAEEKLEKAIDEETLH